MSEEFKEQGGAATMDPNPVLRWLTSRVMTRISKPGFLEKRRSKAERVRRTSNAPHRVEYLHQVDDGYSHLALQALQQLRDRYDIALSVHLVPAAQGKNAPEPELLQQLSRYDASLVAPAYGLGFPDSFDLPSTELVTLAGSILANLSEESFIVDGPAVSEALWSGDRAALGALAEKLGTVDGEVFVARLQQGRERRAHLGHYSGAMFYYAGEWYWGVDRLYHLEKRLASVGADRNPGSALLFPRPEIITQDVQANGALTLQIFPSLRSPYTAISFARALQLVESTGVKMELCPVLPMVMRGVPATRQKGVYIFTDAAREAREAGVDYGNFYDPIGNPVRRAYSLYPWAAAQGKGAALIEAFLDAAFVRGVNTNRTGGLRKVVENAGLDWREAREHLGSTEWEALLERNRKIMYDAGLWGVPSFRLLGSTGGELLAVWGQDRLWLVADVIRRQLAN